MVVQRSRVSTTPPPRPTGELASSLQTEPGRVPGPCPRGWRSLLGSPAAPSSLLPALSWPLWLTDRCLSRAFQHRRNVFSSYPPPVLTSDHVSLSTCRPAQLTHMHAQVHTCARPPCPPRGAHPTHRRCAIDGGGGRFSCLYGPPLLLPLQALGVLANIWGGGVLARPHGPCRARGSPRKTSPQFGCCVDAAPGGALLAGWVVPTPVPTTTELTRQPRLCARGRVDGWADGRMDVSFACGGSGSPWGSQVLSGTPGSCGTATEQDTWPFLPGEGPPEGSP